MSRKRLIAAIAGFGLALSGTALGVTRTEAIIKAKAFSFHPWTAKTQNGTASCNGAYKSIYAPGDYMGLPYDWGGYMSLFQFDQEIAQGYGAGSYPADGILSCTSGLDCSGFVSQAWGSGHHTTSDVDQVSSVISQAQLLPGDIFNDAGNHMAMYSHLLANGEPALYESVFYNVHYSLPGWSWLNGFIPRRYKNITGTSAADPSGTTENPIVISSFPFVDSRNTAQSLSDVLDGCALDPSVPESGPEYIYKLTVSQPGVLSVSVSDDVGVDIDVHLYESMNTNDCVARHDTSFSKNIDCGSYYVVADTFAKAGTALSGPYTLTVNFTPSSGQACGAGPKKYQFKGGPSSACSYPGNKSLPFCNPNLGVDTCLYTSSSSFCSKPCTGVADCAAFPGGCCADIGAGEKYCMPSSKCGGAVPDSGVTPKPDAGGEPGDASFGGAAGTSGAGGVAGSAFGGAAGSAFGGAAGGVGVGGTSAAGGAPGVGAASGAGGAAAGSGTAKDSGDSSGCGVAPRSGAHWWMLALALGLTRRRRARSA